MMIHDANNLSQGYNAVSSIATSENYMASNVHDSSHLLEDSKWLNVTKIIHDQALDHGCTMDEYQSYGPPQKRTNIWLWWKKLLPLEHVVQKL